MEAEGDACLLLYRWPYDFQLNSMGVWGAQAPAITDHIINKEANCRFGQNKQQCSLPFLDLCQPCEDEWGDKEHVLHSERLDKAGVLKFSDTCIVPAADTEVPLEVLVQINDLQTLTNLHKCAQPVLN